MKPGDQKMKQRESGRITLGRVWNTSLRKSVSPLYRPGNHRKVTIRRLTKAEYSERKVIPATVWRLFRRSLAQLN